MVSRIQELILALLKEVDKNEELDPSIKSELLAIAGEKAQKEKKVEVPEEAIPEKTEKEKEATDLSNKLNLKAQYVNRLNTLRHFALVGEGAEFSNPSVPSPTFEAVKNSFSAEELEFASTFRKPMLLLIPEASLAYLVKAMGSVKQKVIKAETYINESYTEAETLKDEIVGWRACIVEGLDEMVQLEGDNLNATFAERNTARKAAKKPMEKGIDSKKYCMLIMESVKADHPIDQKMFTLLDDDPSLSETKIPAADYDPVNKWIRFNWRHPDDVNVCARFRPSVGGSDLLKDSPDKP